MTATAMAIVLFAFVLAACHWYCPTDSSRPAAFDAARIDHCSRRFWDSFYDKIPVLGRILSLPLHAAIYGIRHMVMRLDALERDAVL